MKDKNKTKAQLINELAQMRQLLQTEREQRVLAEKLHQTGTVLSSAHYFDTVLDYALEEINVFLAHDAICIMLVENEIVRIARWHGYTQLDMESSFFSFTTTIDKSPTLQKIQKTGQPLIISFSEDGDPLTDLGKNWIESSIVLPIHIQEQLIGFLKVDRSSPPTHNQSDVDQLQHFVHQITTALRNAQLYNQARRGIAKRVVALKKERSFVSGALNMTSALVMVLTPKGYIIRFNRACEQTTGYSFNEIKGKCFWDLFLPPDEVTQVKNIFKALQTGQQAQNNYESSWLTKGGKHKLLIAWSNNVLLGNDDQAEYVISTGVDITKRKQLEERMVAIHQLGRELNLVRNEADICNVALETAAFLLDFNSHGYGVINDTDHELAYHYYPNRGVPQEIETRLPLDTEQRIYALAVINGHTPNNHLWLTVPMRIGQRTIGVLDFKGDTEGQFTANDQQLLQTLADQTAVAIENARLHRETRQRVDELSTMGMISQAVTSTLNLESTLTIIANHAIRLLDAMAASVVLQDEAKSDLWFHTASGGVPDFVRGVRLAAGQGIVGWVIQNGEPALVPDVSNDVRFFEKIDRETGFITHSVICVPLQTETQTTGAIEVMNKQTGLFTQEDLRLLNWLATPATIAIENARLFEAEHAARKQAEILREATNTLTSSLDLKQVLNSILVHLEHVVPCDNTFVLLQNEEWLQVVADRNVSYVNAQPNHKYPANDAVYQEIQDTRHPVIVADVQKDPRFKAWRSSDQLRGWMGVPLMVQNEVIGCLTLNNQEAIAYDQIEAALAQAFANQAAVAIHNAQLFEQVRVGHKQLQSLSHRLVQIQELERRHIARELHDEAGQALTSLMVGLRLLEREVNDPDLVIDRVIELKRTTNNVLENLHRLAMDLRPASLDHLGLIAALRQYIESFNHQHNLNTQFEVVGLDDKRLASTVETNLYRIVQEALTNVVKHAQASRVDVLLERRGDQVVTIVEDNGIGFDIETADQNRHLGLLGMQERAEMLDGTLVIESIINTSTTLYVEIPYDNSYPNS